MKSKYAELLTAKLNDMDLVLFEKHREWAYWTIVKQSDKCFMVSDNFEYFLCLPKHESAVLRGLNGETAESTNEDRDGWSESSVELWDKDWWYMCDNYVSRIKPKKEKRWIVWDTAQSVPERESYKSLEDAMSNFDYPDAQFIEIEVEA